jgi:mannose-1-phosphate guanylyltransferase
MTAEAAASDDAFLHAFESCAIDLERWSHRCHVRMAYLYVTRHGYDEGLRRVRDLDDAGNGALGDAHFTDATGNVVHAESGTVVMFGVSQLLVVTRAGLTFVTTLDRAADLKPLLDSLPGSARINPGSLGQ